MGRPPLSGGPFTLESALAGVALVFAVVLACTRSLSAAFAVAALPAFVAVLGFLRGRR
jgi:hypothetical protein